MKNRERGGLEIKNSAKMGQKVLINLIMNGALRK